MELRRALAIKAKGRVALGSKFFYSCWLHFCSKERLPQFLRHSCLLMGFVTPREESHFSSFYVMQMWSTLELSSAISFVKLSLAWVGSSTTKHYEFYIKTVPWLDISIDGCRIRPLAGKIRKKSLNVVLGLKIDGCMHPWPQIDRCSCAPRTRTNQDGLQIGSLYAYGQNLTLHGQVKK